MFGLPGKRQTVRGYAPVNLLLIDEAAWVPEEMYSAVTPMLAVSGGDLWMMSTPAGKRGFFREEWDRGGPLWTRVSVPATECPADLEGVSGGGTAAQGQSVFQEELIRRAIRPDVTPLFGPPGEGRSRG